MDTIWAGYAFAVISSIFSAVYVVPKKLSKQRPSTYAMIMGIGYFAASVLGFATLKTLYIIDEPLFFPRAHIACINGVVWTAASISVLSSIDRIGLAKSNQWKSLQGPVGSFLMLIFLAEFLTAKVVYIIAAIVLITAAALMFSTRGRDNSPTDHLGIVQALTAALFYGISATLNKMLTNDGILFAQQIYQSFFVVITSAVYVLFKYRSLKINVPELPRKIKREIILPVIGGVLFFGNNCFSVMAYDCMEGSIVLMLHQLNAIWLFLLGVFLFKEIDFKKYWLRLTGGLALSAAGVIMLVFAKV